MARVSVAAPLATGLVTPWLAPDATALLGAGVLAWAGTAVTGYFGKLPARLTRTAPGAALYRQSADHMLLSLASGVAVTVAAGQGAAGIDALALGTLADPVSLTGTVSAMWLAAQGWCAFRLRHALTGRPRKKPAAAAKTAAQAAPAVSREETIADAIDKVWAEHIAADARPGVGHRLSRIGIAADGTFWLAEIVTDGRIIAPGLDKHISAAYHAPRVTITPGDHAGHAHLRVDMVLPDTVEGPSLEGLEAMWQRPAVQRLLPDSTVTGTADEWGQVLTVEMPESEAVPETIDLRKLARAVGAKDMAHISWEPRQDAGGGILRVFDRHPLRSRLEMPEDAVLYEGWVPVGVTATGATEYVQLYDGASARHLFVAGSTGAGKSVALDAVMRSAHRGGMGVIYGDGKGGSSDYASLLAAWRSEGGAQEAMQALRVGYALMKYRQQSGRWVPGHSGPRMLLMVDEINEVDPADPEAKLLVWRIAKNARSLGISFVLAGQSVSGDMVPGGVAARDQVIGNGGALLFRTSAVQKAVAGGSSIAGVDPDKIPQHWPDTTADPTQRESTAGLHYATAGGTAVLSKSYAPPVDTRTMTPDEFEEWLSGYLGDTDPQETDAIKALAAEWPDWSRREEIAHTPVDPKKEGASGSGAPEHAQSRTVITGLSLGTPTPQPKATTNEDLVVQAIGQILAQGLTAGRSPLEGVSVKEILEATGLSRPSVETVLARSKRIVKRDRGRYSLPQPHDRD
jgi:hypothetical protein